ncbi:MAG: LD-carboxypeptidase, partial [Dehalococcoidales bacterium]
GDKIGIVAPSMHIIDEEAVKNGISTLRELGFNVEVGPTVYSKYRNTTAVPSDRVREIMDFFTDSETKAIICLIGGDTVVQLLKLLDYETIQNNPKIFSGMSDIGHLSLAFLSKANLAPDTISIHLSSVAPARNLWERCRLLPNGNAGGRARRGAD